MANERQAKDGTFYKQVGQDEWAPVTRQDKQGNVYKKVGEDAWAVMTENKPKGATAGDKGMAALEGFAKSSSMGTLPYLQAAGEMATDKLAGAVYGSPQSSESYSDRVDRARQRSEGIKEKAPGYALAGEIAGYVAPGSAVSKGVGAAGKALGIQSVAKTAPLINRIAGQSGRLAAEGAAFGLAYTPDSGFSDMGARAESAATGAAFGAIMPPAMHAGGKALSAAAKVPGWAGKKVLSSLGGVKEEVIERYLQNPERIRNAKTFDELYETTSKIVGQLGDDLDNAKINYDAAKKHLDDVAEGIKTSRVEGRDAALEQVTQAKSMLDESFKGTKESLKQQANPSNIEPQVTDAIGKLKNQVTKGSAESFEILGDELAPTKVMDYVPGRVAELSKRGSDASKQAIPKLKEYADKIFSAGATDDAGNFLLPAKEIKRFIQDIDSDVGAWQKATGSFDDAYTKELKGLRNSLDEQLKGSNETYRQQMIGVAEDTRLLGEASKRFGEPGRAVSRMSNLEKPSAKIDKDILLNIAKREGQDLTESINKMTKAQRTLQSPIRMDDVRRSLPEASALREAEMKAAAAKRLAKPNLVKEAIKKNAANYKLKSAAEKLQAQKEVFGRLKSFGEQGAESKLQQVARGKKWAETQLSELSTYADEDLVEAVKSAQDAAAFDKTIFHGSRNVNLWAVLGSAVQNTATGKGGVGAAGGAVFGGPMGMAIGATIGALMDNYGPRVTRQILDGVVKIKGPVSELAIMKMKLPENVKADLAKQFQKTVMAERIVNAAKSGVPKVAEEKPKGEDKWAQDGFEKLKKHASPDERKKLDAMREEILRDPRKRKKVISASELNPGSKSMENVLREINSVKEEK